MAPCTEVLKVDMHAGLGGTGWGFYGVEGRGFMFIYIFLT